MATRLDVLKKERELVASLHTLSFDLKEAADEYYEVEINAIELYGASNPTLR
jgi:hypothetical protein